MASRDIVDFGSQPSLRELEILAVYARLGNMQEAADEMGLSIQTVKNNCAVVYTRLGAHSGIEAFHKLGWLVVPPDAAIKAEAGVLDTVGLLESVRNAVSKLISELRAPDSDTAPVAGGVVAATPVPSVRRLT